MYHTTAASTALVAGFRGAERERARQSSLPYLRAEPGVVSDWVGYIDVAAIDVPNVAVPNAVWAAQDRVAAS